MANHYITVDSKNRVIDGFSDAFKWPAETDILLREDAPEIFGLFGNDPGRPLSFLSQGVEIWLYKWTGQRVEQRTQAEINADLPAMPYSPTVDERIAANTYDIETLNMAMDILLSPEV